MRVIQSLLSGIVVYVGVAACVAVEGHNYDAGALSSVDASVHRPIVDAVADALVDPVSDAKADTLTPPQVDVELCDKADSTGGTMRYAVHAYPGKTSLDLSALRVVCTMPKAYAVTIGGDDYPDLQFPVHGVRLRDGSAAAACGGVNSGMCGKVTFILPLQ